MANSPPPQPTSSVPAHDLTGTRVGRFAIRARLGAGGMGEVYLADDTKLKRPVALKRVAPRFRSDPSYRRRLLSEAQRASFLSDQHIARVYDVFEENDETFLVMEYVQGVTLRHSIHKPAEIKGFLNLAVQCAQALVAAHDKSIVHCDIKPENIMLTPAGQVTILDFGVAKGVAEREDPNATETVETQTGPLIGTPAYMAPEVLLGKEPDGRADIFSLGVVFYEALTGRHPFRAPTSPATNERILHEGLPPLDRPVPAELKRILVKMLAKDPAERYVTAADLLVDLRALERGRPPPQPWKFNLRVAVVLVLLALICTVSYWIWHQWQNRGREATIRETPPVHSIAILPFRNIGRSTEYDYFGVGLADVLNARLTNARFLEVRSPGALVDLADPKLSALSLGQHLGVDAVLSGSYQIEAGMLSLNYTLIDVRRNVQIAGDTFENPFVHAIDMEHRLAAAIVDSLRVSASQEERANFTAVPTHEDEAFQAYLRSDYEMEQFWKRPSVAQLSRVEHYLNEALRVDPHFTLALVSLAKLHWISAFRNYARDPDVLDRAEQEADQAIAQDPNLADAYAAKALVEYQRRGQLDEVRQILHKAFACSPHSALSYYAAGFYYMGRGLPDRSVQAFRRARELDPDLVRREVGYAYRYAADFMRAEQQLQEDLQAHPDDLLTAAALAGVLVARGNLEEARRITDDLLRQAPDDPLVQYTLALVQVSEGRPFPAAWLRRYHDIYWSDAGSCINVAGVYAIARQPAEALRWLRRAGELGIRNYVFLCGNPLYANLQQNPEFRSYVELIRREWEDAKRREQQDPLIPDDAHDSALDDWSPGLLGPTPAAYNTDSLAPSTPRCFSIFSSDRAAVQNGAKPSHVATRQNV